MNKKKEELVELAKNVYILKEVFLHDLSLDELRLCVFLTSNLGKTLETMKYNDKMWCVGGRKNNVKKLQDAKSRLIQLELIQPDGLGHSIKDRQFCTPNHKDFYNCKTTREVFIVCLNYWYKNGHFISVDKSYIYTQFGKETRRRNQNIKRIKESLNINFTLEEREKDFLYHKPLKKISKVVKEKMEIGERFELSYGNLLEQQGYEVEYNGINKGVSDGGIDLVATKNDEICYIQCKYWNKSTKVRENVVSQLYGSALNLFLKKNTDINEFSALVKNGKIKLILATHTVLSKEAKEFAERLGIIYEENLQ